MVKWLMFMWQTRACPHARLEGVYGDQINAVGGRRLHCLDCLRYLDGALSLVNTPIDRRLMDAYASQAKLHSVEDPPELPFVPADPDTCTCVDPWSNCPTHG